jgi:hypothetical protein
MPAEDVACVELSRLDAPHTVATPLFTQSLRRNPYIRGSRNRRFAVKNFLIATSVMGAIMVVAVLLRALLFLPGRMETENAQAQVRQEATTRAEYSNFAQRPVEMPCLQQPWWVSGLCVVASGNAAFPSLS